MLEPLQSFRPVLVAEIEQLRQVVRGLSDQQLVLATSCIGWRVADLVVHLRMSCEAVLMSLSDRTTDEPDRDFVTYWATGLLGRLRDLVMSGSPGLRAWRMAQAAG